MPIDPKLRNASRVAVNYPASLGDGVVETQAVGVDLSRTGIGMRSALHWLPGTRVTVKLFLPDATCAVAFARVVRSDGDAIGLQFLNQSPRFNHLVSELVSAPRTNAAAPAARNMPRGWNGPSQELMMLRQEPE